MGGMMIIGIRRSNGDEFWMERPTNAQPYLLTDPELLNEGKGLDSYLDISKFKEKDVYLYHKEELKDLFKNLEYVEDELEESELNPGYGCILIDFINKKMVSRNGYCSMDEIIFSSSKYGECMLDRFKQLKENDLIEKTYRSHWFEGDKNREISQEVALSILEEPNYNYIYVRLKNKPIDIDSKIDNSHEAIQWARDNGWKLAG